MLEHFISDLWHLDDVLLDFVLTWIEQKYFNSHRIPINDHAWFYTPILYPSDRTYTNLVQSYPIQSNPTQLIPIHVF